MATFQFNPLSDWRASEVALRLATRADMGLHGIQIAHPRVLVDLARVDRLVPRERLMDASGLQPGDLLRLVANLRHHLLQPTRDPSWRTLPLEGWPAPLGADTPDPWRPVEVTCAAGGGGWQVALADGRRLMVLQADTDADEDENTAPPGATTLERHVDSAWGEVCDHLRQMGITVVPLEAPESALDDLAWRLEAVLADLPLLLAELNNRRASARKMGRTPAFSLRSWAPL
jgi:hypothetical protein